MMKRAYLSLIVAMGIALGMTPVSASAQAKTPVTVGQPVPDIAVADSAGTTHRLSDLRGKIVVLEWTSPSCPFVAGHYAGTMQATQKWATDNGIVWLSVLSTGQSRGDYLSPSNAAAFNADRKAAPTALLMDTSGILGRAFGARTTPHMYVIDKDGKLVYAGAIDDKPSHDPATIVKSQNYVRAAIEDLRAGRPVKLATTKPYGCGIGYGG